jgi:polygalacturonase
MKKYNVKEFGAVADGKTLCTKAVQNAVDYCYMHGGGIVLFDGGRYVLSTVFLKDNVHIEISEGTEILGSLNFYDFAPQEKIDYPIYQDASHTYFDLSMFVGRNCENISIVGKGKIDMRSVWDEDGVRGAEIRHRGPKCIALKECKNVEISGLEIVNVTDLAVYFAGCENVDVHGLKLYVYIDGISPDNSKNVRIYDCDVEAGDDSIVFKSSYTLNRLDICKDIKVWDCRLKSRCTAIKFGTETNGGFENIQIENIDIRETRIMGIGIESVDGAIIDGVYIKNVTMKNVNAPLFIHIGKRMRGPKGRDIGKIRNVTLENITATGPYEPYEIVAWNYDSFKANDFYQDPKIFGRASGFDGTKAVDDWQMTSNMCGLKGYPLENITLRNVHLKLDGGVKEYNRNVPETAQDYPEVYVYGRILPAKGIYFRHIEGLTLENVTVETYREDKREDFVFEQVTKAVVKK